MKRSPKFKIPLTTYYIRNTIYEFVTYYTNRYTKERANSK